MPVKTHGTINKCKKDIKARLGKQASGEAVVHAIDVFHRCSDQLLRQRLKAMPPVGFACRKGCDPCCHLRIEALPPEVFRIVAHLETLAGTRRRVLVGRLERHLGYARGKTYRDYHAPCPFLGDGGACSIYAVRPRICRSHLSTSRSACETPGNARPDPALRQAGDALAMAVIDIYKQRGLCMHPAELGQAVLRALTDDTLKGRWLAGEDVFERLPEGITL